MHKMTVTNNYTHIRHTYIEVTNHKLVASAELSDFP